MHASNKPVSEDEEENDVFSLRPLYCGRAGSDVIGCRRPTSGVLYMYASGTGYADDVPHSGPYGTQFEVPMKGKCSFTSLAHQWILCSEWVPSEWESKQLINTSQ